jgi:hypothetical protein
MPSICAVKRQEPCRHRQADYGPWACLQIAACGGNLPSNGAFASSPPPFGLQPSALLLCSGPSLCFLAQNHSNSSCMLVMGKYCHPMDMVLASACGGRDTVLQSLTLPEYVGRSPLCTALVYKSASLLEGGSALWCWCCGAGVVARVSAMLPKALRRECLRPHLFARKQLYVEGAAWQLYCCQTLATRVPARLPTGCTPRLIDQRGSAHGDCPSCRYLRCLQTKPRSKFGWDCSLGCRSST